MLSATIVMAAGMGTRMKSATPKVLHRILGRPLVQFPVRLALEVTDAPVVVVGGEFLDDLRRAARADTPTKRVRFALQEQALGTADAVRAGLSAIPRATDAGRRGILILNGDVPGLSPETLGRLIGAFEAGLDVAFLGFHAEDPAGYGRVLHDDSGTVLSIREEKELDPADREIDLVNGGIYLVEEELLRKFIDGVQKSEHHGEYLLTDVVEYALRVGRAADVVVVTDASELQGVNTRVHLAAVTRCLRRERNEALMLDGVTIPNPDTVDVDYGVTIGPDTLLEQGVNLRGTTHLAGQTVVGRGTVVVDCVIGAHCAILPYCVLESSEIHEHCAIGPFAHTRPGTVLEDGAKLGNFVETKKTRVGIGSKVNHLTYLGDCDVGRKVNVGAGTITCNYDGVNKHKTILGDRVFVGSDVQLVAPVEVGDGAVLAAGATITRDVPPGALAISRTAQINVEGYAERKRKEREVI
ncbi:MAG: bifunctional UDP-N-acetylglucosamine diphosphorylase/glucosamine-1-phosphate N-acetyltransferase GlmU [Pseudomonadota bacterium]